MTAALVEVQDLAKTFDVSAPWLNRVVERKPRQFVHAVDGVSFRIERGKTLALVGESGCGKSTVARLLVGLYGPTRGTVRFDGQDTRTTLNSDAARTLHRRMQMIFQDPYASLNPRWKVLDIVGEPLREHGMASGSDELKAKVADLLRSVGLAAADVEKFPHQFSGGQRQRISIARALATQPEFLVCDEPTSALDVSVQAQVLNIMKDLQRERGLTYLFISHNLAVVRHVADDVGTWAAWSRSRPRPSCSRARATPTHACCSTRSPTSTCRAAHARRCRARCRTRSSRRVAAPSIRAARTPTHAARASGRR
jgi:peptide/nickel transport system ATP-binding protein